MKARPPRDETHVAYGSRVRAPAGSVNDPLLGCTVGGRYQLISKLGSGGMSSVYLARHVAIDRFVAVKAMRRDLAQDPVQRSRFTREARAVNRINHENVVEISDFGETEDGIRFLVMEYVPGQSLLKALQRAPFPARKCIRIGRQVASGLARAHQMGVVHRDLKPENILLLCQDNREDFVKILDFGIAKVLDAPSLTGSQQIFGTPGYIAPEYIQSTEIDGRADLYSLGVLLYEMSTGALPFNYRYSSDLLIKHVTETPIPPRRRYPSVEEPLDAFILRCLNKDPNERFQDAYHFLEELARVNELLSSEPPDDRCSPNRPTSEVETNVRRDAFEQIRTTSETGEVESERIEALTVRGVSENSLHSDLGFSTWRERYELMRNLLLRCRTPYPERVEEDLHALEILFAEAHQSVSAARSASEELAVVELLRRERLLALGQTVDDLGAELSRSRRELEIRSRERELLLPDELGHTGCLKTSVESCLSDQAIRELELRIDELEVQLARRHRELEKSQLKWERERTKFAKRIASHTSHCEQRSLELQAALERTEAHLGSLHAKGRISTTSIEALRKEQLLSKIEDDL